MYDPIVLEDLADWLNHSAGIAEMAREAAVARPPNDDNDGDVDDIDDVEAAVVVDVEGTEDGDHVRNDVDAEQKSQTQKQKQPKKGTKKDKSKEKENEWEIKPAVLQKWCEENSICCLWKGGLRGGVRARY